jgi:hypothetical protein
LNRWQSNRLGVDFAHQGANVLPVVAMNLCHRSFVQVAKDISTGSTADRKSLRRVSRAIRRVPAAKPPVSGNITWLSNASVVEPRVGL